MKIIKSINIYKHIWELAERLSKIEHRSISNLIECLIVEEAKKRGIADYDFERQLIKDYARQK